MRPSRHREITISRPRVGNDSDNKVPVRVKVAHLLLRIRGGSVPSLRLQNAIKVVCVSDTHNTTPPLDSGDILLHSGDLSQYGTFAEIQRQLDWLNAQPHTHKIVVAGNHDLLLDAAFVDRHPDRELNKPGASARDLNWGSVIYLENDSVELVCGSRTIRVFGSPNTPRCGNFAFQYDSLQSFWAGRLPADTDILVTHGQPALHLDGNKGCHSLLEELWTVRPRLVVFGHVHHARGRETMALTTSQRLTEAITLTPNSWAKLPVLLWTVCAERLRTQPNLEWISLVNAACNDGENYVVVEI
nr:putative rhamnogalacturonate lyase c [Quercus suber]